MKRPGTLAERLVRDWYCLETRAIPEAILARAALCVKDTLGVAIAARTLGVGLAATKVALEADGAGHSAVWGAARSATPEDATLANGTLAHALDFDDTHAAAIMHASSVIVPPALALGEALRVPSREILAALVIGYQFAARLGRLAPGPFQDNGFQATSVLGAFAATAVAARLLRLTPSETVNALGTAGSMASGLMAYLSDGSDVKQMHPGWAGMSGIRAARLAKAGFRGPRAVFEYRLGVFQSFAKVDIFNKWQNADGAPWEVELMAPKPYPACLCVHAPVQAILRMRAAGKISAARADDIANILCDVPDWYVNLVFEPAAAKAAPRTPYEARFSAPWTMARALIDGGLDVWSFGPEKLSDPAALDLCARTTYRREALAEFPAAFPARVTVTMRSGERHEEYVAHNLGTPGNPMTAADIERKFLACATPALGGRAAEVSALIDSFSQDDGAERLFQALRGLEVAPPR
ncbi:MAG: MmgE/PrpD family protein [Gemmatimonadaceae bacterium]|nr:MmgE/PrpD family protein [Gemmatimonadaceae bacterium]